MAEGELFAPARDVGLIDELLMRHAVEPSAAQRDALVRYAALCAQWERRVDLTAARDATQLVELLLVDALVLCDEALVPRDARVLDVGAGVGAPTLPLLVLREDLKAVLLEPRRKRVAFLRTAVGSLGLAERVEAREGRVDRDAPDVEGAPFDLAVSRATFPPAQWLSVGLALASRVLVLTAGEAPQPARGIHRLTDARYSIPSTGAPRTITAYERLG